MSEAPYFYRLDTDGNPVIERGGPVAWSQWFETADRTVERTEENGVLVSTVFLGTDHAFRGGPPLLFETMIFGGDHEGYQERYSTREEAIVGHDVAVALVRNGKP